MANNLKRHIFLTGQPGVGKTNVLLRAVDVLRAKKYKIGGMISREVREQGVRVGFEIVNLGTGEKGWLAHVNQRTGPRIGKYRVNMRDLNTIGAGSILNALKAADIIAVDEVGPMELFSHEFKEAVTKAMKSKKPLIGTIHYRARDPLINAVKAQEDAEILEVTHENRGRLHLVLVNRIVGLMQRKS